MAHKYAELVFTPAVRDLQVDHGSRESYARMDEGEDYNHKLGARESGFIGARDSFYMASISETGWPYLQHRGGPVGFVKILDDRTIAFADYSGNRQYVSAGNFHNNDKVALFFMDYPNHRRLKMLGRIRMESAEKHETAACVEDLDYPAQVERIATVQIEAFDWNCPQHITPRFSDAELDARVAIPRAKVVAVAVVEDSHTAAADAVSVLGDGPLELKICGIRQLTPKIRGFELHDASGADLPEFTPGSHIVVPLRLANGVLVDRHYSLASDPQRSGVWEIAVHRDDQGAGGSQSLHDHWQLGTTFKTTLPLNHFALHADKSPAILIAGGIGITPLKAMAHALNTRGSNFVLHYAVRSLEDMAFREELVRKFGKRLVVSSAADNARMDLERIFREATDDAVFYVCGPERLISAALSAARKLGFTRDRLQIEAFA